jgi:hypothetical protein
MSLNPDEVLPSGASRAILVQLVCVTSTQPPVPVCSPYDIRTGDCMFHVFCVCVSEPQEPVSGQLVYRSLPKPTVLFPLAPASMAPTPVITPLQQPSQPPATPGAFGDSEALFRSGINVTDAHLAAANPSDAPASAADYGVFGAESQHSSDVFGPAPATPLDIFGLMAPVSPSDVVAPPAQPSLDVEF